MDTTTATETVPVRLDIDAHAPSFMKAVAHLDTAARRDLERVGFPAGLAELPAAAYDTVAAHWSDDEVGALVGLVVAISAWNAVGVSVRPWAAGSYSG